MTRIRTTSRGMLAVLALLGAATLGTVVLAVTVETEPRTVEERFQESNRAFDRGMESSGEERKRWLRTSVSLLEEILSEDGIENGHLYYNLGNAYQALGRTGQAILNYRRAERLIPGDSNLAENLDAAIRSRIDRGGPGQLSKIVRTLSLRSYWVDYPATVRLFTASFVAFWLLLAIRLFRRPPGFRIIAATVLVVSLFSAGAAAYYLVTDRTDRSGVIISAESDARKGPGRSYEASFTEPLHGGTEFVLLGTRSGWSHIRLEDDEQCWVLAADAEMVRPLD